MRRVAVTGMGLVTPLAAGVEVMWRKLVAGEAGIARIAGFEADDLPCRIAAQVPDSDAEDGPDPDAVMSARDRSRVALFIVYALAAAGVVEAVFSLLAVHRPFHPGFPDFRPERRPFSPATTSRRPADG